jgi:hypothetical protein
MRTGVPVFSRLWRLCFRLIKLLSQFESTRQGVHGGVVWSRDENGKLLALRTGRRRMVACPI